MPYLDLPSPPGTDFLVTVSSTQKQTRTFQSANVSYARDVEFPEYSTFEKCVKKKMGFAPSIIDYEPSIRTPKPIAQQQR